MMPDRGVEPDTLSGDAPDDHLWDNARAAVASLESSADTAPRWVAALLGLSFALLFLLYSFVLAHITAARSLETLDRIEHSRAILDQAARTNAARLKADRALFGYALTGAGADSYRQAKAAMWSNLTKLEGMVSDQPNQRRTMAALRDLMGANDNLYGPAGEQQVPDRESLAARLTDPSAAQGDRQFAADIGARFDAIGTEEFRALTERQRATNNDEQAMQLLADLGILLAIISGAISLLLIQGERGRNRLRELQLEFMHTQRLALMGQTTVALAHEVKQPLTAASNYLAVLKNISAGGGQLPPERAKELVPKIEHQIQRAGEIVQRLRNFLAVRGGERVSETPKTLIADAVDLLGTLDNSIKLETHIELSLPPVLVDRVQVQQVLVNLMRNALEAMKHQSQRRLILKAAAMPGRKVKISIEDNGSGLPAEVSKNLFKPFVSSKRSGMGVGLSICHTIVTAHGGRIWADSTSEGTVFHFTLPATGEV
jgi:C4-dicarboxylate-specific signal transduction histidine kinase